MTKNKFSATEWKDSVDHELAEVRKTLIAVSNYLSLLEQWRQLPFNPPNGENNETNTRGNQEDERTTASKKSYGSTGSNPKSKKRNSGHVARKGRSKTKKLKP